ncbi:hypothetical protein EV663_105167 [Rhodovulum bhavnagarense]|uniref:Uncharacterized protein n=1 Tax=Rhodovulum bhavnagarense TaxID=992286 RepID=A0A4R2RGD1_9RHOB|nr:hypothetical protein [Rhodovulum bhavnagarense]TCP61449.1 hypothetical protein EV663_105167 [Rhodovulum bhavnagarense]
MRGEILGVERRRYWGSVPGTDSMAHARIARALFPLTLSLQDGPGPYLRWHLVWSGWAGLIGIVLSLAALAALARTRHQTLPQDLPAAALVTLTGPAGFLALMVVPVTRQA